MELAGRVSQISLDMFMAEFVPGPDVPPGAVIEALNPSSFRREAKTMCNDLCSVANSVLSSASVEEGVPRFKAKSMRCWSDPDQDGEHSRRCTNVVFYPDHDGIATPYAIEPKALKQKSEEDRNDQMETEARTSWLWASLVLEAKSNMCDSPFVVPKQEVQAESDHARQTFNSGASNVLPLSVTDPALPTPNPAPVTQEALLPAGVTSMTDAKHPFLRLDATGGKKTMAQMTKYVSRVLDKQFVLFFFTVFICCNHAWLLRWDRAGLVVSEPFDFLEQPHLLHRFIYRFACLGDAQRGRDTTVNLASEEEVQLVRSFKGKLTPWQETQFNAAFKSDYPVYRVEVPQADVITVADLKAGKKVPREESNSSGEQKRLFLVGRPHFTYGSVIGRGTRGHIAYDVSDGRVVFCKEYWRLHVSSHHPEGETLLELHSKRVQYIATPLVLGDVRSGDQVHCTRSQDFRQRPGAKYVQHRVIVAEVGEPLKNYATSYELVGIMYEAMIDNIAAHEQAWKVARILHRDISAHNILIYRYFDDTGKLICEALLIDWGLCKRAAELRALASESARSGSWQFISAALLAFPGRFKYEVWHDLESFIHVLHWMCLRFQLTNYSRRPAKFSATVRQLYDACQPENGQSVGGEDKLKFLQAGIVPFKLRGGSAAAPHKSSGLHQLLTALARLYGLHYKLLEPTLDPAGPNVPEQATRPFTKTQMFGSRSRSTALAKELMPESSTPPKEPATVTDGPIISHATAPNQPNLTESPFNHDEILALFSVALGRVWTDDPKQNDQFAEIRSLMKQDPGSGWSRGTKRRSDSSWEDSSGKRGPGSGDDVRSATATGTPLLGSISEDAEHVFQG